MADQMKMALAAEDEVDDEEIPASRQLKLSRNFFWRSNRLRAGEQICPDGLTLDQLPPGATIDGAPNPKYKKVK